MEDNIFLSGGGSATESFIFDDIFLKSSGERILYLPVGLKRTFAGYDGCVVWFTEMLTSHQSNKKVSVWVHIKDKVEKIDKENFDSIYIGGASETLRLHNIFKKYGVYPQLAKFIEQGGKIYGGSGGATVLGKSINYDQMEKKLPFVDEDSADICFGYSVFTHLNEDNLPSVNNSIDQVIAIPQSGGVVLNTANASLKYIGKEECLVFNKSKKISIKNNQTVKILSHMLY